MSQKPGVSVVKLRRKRHTKKKCLDRFAKEAGLRNAWSKKPTQK
jgi:hypothetical protein